MAKRIIAPIDEKNVCSDWIEGVFDYNCGYTEKRSTHKYCGYFGRGEVLVECSYTFGNNTLKWVIYSNGEKLEDTKKELLSTLKEIDKESETLLCEYQSEENVIYQSFYWNDDEE